MDKLITQHASIVNTQKNELLDVTENNSSQNIVNNDVNNPMKILIKKK